MPKKNATVQGVGGAGGACLAITTRRCICARKSVV